MKTYVLTWRPRCPGADDAVSGTSNPARLFRRGLVGHVADDIVYDNIFQDVDAPAGFRQDRSDGGDIYRSFRRVRCMF